MANDYDRYIDTIATLLVTPASDENFRRILPTMIAYAEGRIYRELDLLTQVVSDASSACTAGSRKLTLPTDPRFNIVSEINVVTPVGTASPDAGMRNPLIPVTKEYLDLVYGSTAGAALPTCFAMLTDQVLLLGPWPDQAYQVEVVGLVRPKPLSDANTSTFLTQILFDLFVAASMVFGTGYQRNFGAQSDDPRAALSWEQQYTTLFAGANADETRRKFSAAAGTSAAQSIVSRSDRSAPTAPTAS